MALSTPMEKLANIVERNDILIRFGLTNVGVFGSAVRSQAANDIDILIEDDVPLDKLVLLRAELQSALDMPVDIVIARFANPIVLYRARKEIRYVGKH